MNRTATRTALVTLGLAALAGCIVNLSFSMDKKDVVLKTEAGQPTVLTQQSIPVNLGDYKEVTDHKDQIKSLDLDYVDVTITAVGPTNAATTVSGTLAVRKSLTDDPANDIPVGSLNNVAIHQGQNVRINGTPTLDAFLLQQLQNAGSFYVIISGNVDNGPADLTLDVNMHASIGYDAGLF